MNDISPSSSSPAGFNRSRQLLVVAVAAGLLLLGIVLAAGALRDQDGELAVATPVPTVPATLAPSPTTAIRSYTPTIAPRAGNDDPPGIAITTVPYSDSTDTTGAQIHAMEMASTCGSGSQSVWYSFNAEEAMTLVADTFGSDYDTILDIWRGSLTSDVLDPGFETLAPLACNDNAADGVQSEVVFAATPGTSYVIRVTTASGSSGGVLTFHLAEG